MARPRRMICRRCGGHVDDVGALSSRGLCFNCGVGSMLRNADQLHEHRGSAFDHWRRRTLAAFGIIVPERNEVDNP